MRLLPELRAFALILLLAASATTLADTKAVTDKEVAHAVEVIKKDPHLVGEKTVRTLDFDFHLEPSEKKEPREPSNWPSWLGWLGNFFAWIGQASQMLMWLVIATLVALLAWFIVKLIAAQQFTPGSKGFVPPTHVQDLDIRPESLPEDIGAAARALWDRGEQRAALALLYRGLLSRLAHVYEVPIRDSSTEGDCLALATRKLDASRIDFVTRLIRTWQRAIYGGLSIDTAVVHEFCAGFDLNLDKAPAAETPRRTGFASGAPA